MELEELKTWLEANGFKTGIDGLKIQDDQCDWYAYKNTVGGRACECNDRSPQLFIKPCVLDFPNGLHYATAEVEIIGEANELWWTLKAYSVGFHEIPDKIESIERSLLAAWNALT